MKDIKLFLSIVTIFVLMSMLMSCDVFDPNSGGALGGDLDTSGRLYDAITGRDETIDPYPEMPEDPEGFLSFDPVGESPVSDFVFFPKNEETGTFTLDLPIYVVVKKVMTPVFDELYLLGEPDVLQEIHNKYYDGNPNHQLNKTSGMSKLKTIRMETSPINPVSKEIGDCFFIKIPTNLNSHYTKPSWIQSAPTQPLFKGFRMEFVNRAEPDSWDNSRIGMISGFNTNRTSATMTYDKASFIAEPYSNPYDDFGMYYQIRLNYENSRNYYLPK